MNFSIIGPSGYIGKRHLDAINKLDGKIVSYLDLKPSNEVNELATDAEYESIARSLVSLSFSISHPHRCSLSEGGS